jgi:predicted Zn-dependent protease
MPQSNEPAPATDSAALLGRAIRIAAADPAGAEALAQSVLAVRPDDVDALTVIGAARRSQGDPAGAVATLAPLAERTPGSFAVRYELGRALVANGESRRAIAPLEAAVALNPKLGGAWRLLGDIRLVAGDATGAQVAYDRSLAAFVTDPQLVLAANLLADGALADAEAAVRAVLARTPGSAPAAHLAGEILLRRGLWEPARAALAHCLERAPGSRFARQAYALTLRSAGRAGEALAELDRLQAEGPADNRSRMIKAAVLADTGDFAVASDITAQLLETFADQPHAWLLYGNGLRTLGRTDEAISAYRRCLELDPDCGEAWWSLANLKSYRFSPREQAMIEARAAAPDTPAPALLRFALGKACEDDGRDAEAFAHYAAANALERQRRPYDAEATSTLVRRAKALFKPDFFAQRAGWGWPAGDPIFIVGLPRSGSTLVEQILASHPGIEGAGELADIEIMAGAVARRPASGGGYPDQVASLSAADAALLGRDYLARTQARRRLGRVRFVDKAPGNFLHAGLISLMLPNAAIIDVRRHPLGCCLSAYKQHFAGGFDFAYDLEDLGRYYADYVELMAHFDQVLPGRILRVGYEALIADPEGETRRMLGYLGLAFDPACLRFFDNPRPVATPSSEQVRRPISADAADHWRRYEPWLGPLKAALGPALTGYAGG